MYNVALVNATQITKLNVLLFRYRDAVTEEGFAWILKETGVFVKFLSKAVPDPRLVVCFLWSADHVSFPLQENELLVSNVIELACDDSDGISFSCISVALSHSATDLRGYELVIKELVDSGKSLWKDLETTVMQPSGT